MAGQPGFFDLSDRYEALSTAGDPKAGFLWQIYPDCRSLDEGNLLGGTILIDQAFIFQILRPTRGGRAVAASSDNRGAWRVAPFGWPDVSGRAV